MRVLIYGLSKTGTTILSSKVKASLESHLGAAVQDVFEPKEIRTSSDELRYIKETRTFKSEENEVVKALFDSGVTPEEIRAHEDRFDKKIFIVRDPRDRFISQTFYHWHAGHNRDPLEFDRVLRLTKYKEQNPKDLPFTFLHSQDPQSYAGRANWLRNFYVGVISFLKEISNDWYILKYEDLIDGNFSELEQYLGFPILENVEVKKDRRRVVRSKSYGNWRQWFTEDDTRYFQPVFKDYMEFIGYDFGDWLLSDVDKLSPEAGSKYIERIFYSKRGKKRSALINIFSPTRSLRFVKRKFREIAESELRFKLLPKVAPASPHFFIHIPKTGGTSLRKSISSIVGNHNIIIDYPNDPDYSDSLVSKYISDKHDFSGFREEVSKKRNAWLIGHTNFQSYSEVFQESNTVTFIRHPVDRLISSYKHRVRHQGLDCDFEDYARRPGNRNLQSKILAGASLDEMAFIGVTERFSESMEVLNSLLGYKLPILKANEAPNSDELSLPANLYKELCNLNGKDVELFEYANLLLDKKLESIGRKIGAIR